MRRRVLLFFVGAIVVVGVVLLGSHLAAERPLDPVGTVRFAVSRTLSPAPVWIAHERGLFARAGLDSSIHECTTGKSCTEAMLAGTVDFSAAAEFLATRVSFTRKDLRILGSTAFVHTIELLGLKERGIATVADLAGKRVGVRLGTNGEYFLARLLTLNGMDRSDVTWVDMLPQAMGDALDAGSVDAVLVWPPFTQRIAARLGERLVALDGQPGQDYYYLVLGREDWLASHGVIAERTMLALKWAEEWIAADPARAADYMAAKFGVARDEMERTLEGYRFAVALPQALLSAVEAERYWLLESGLVDGTPVRNSLDLITFEALEAVAPDAVTVVRGRAPAD